MHFLPGIVYILQQYLLWRVNTFTVLVKTFVKFKYYDNEKTTEIWPKKFKILNWIELNWIEQYTVCLFLIEIFAFSETVMTLQLGTSKEYQMSKTNQACLRDCLGGVEDVVGVFSVSAWDVLGKK